jgi:hypothetical protein
MLTIRYHFNGAFYMVVVMVGSVIVWPFIGTEMLGRV